MCMIFFSGFIFAQNEPLIRVYKDKKAVYLNQKGDIVLETPYKYAWDFNEGLARVKKGIYYGFINNEGNLIVETKYTDAIDFSEGIAVVETKETDKTTNNEISHFHFIDKKGNIIFSHDIIFKQGDVSETNLGYLSRHYSYYSNGLMRIKNKYGPYVDKKGKKAITVFCANPAKVPEFQEYYDKELDFVKKGELKEEDRKFYQDNKGNICVMNYGCSVTTDFSEGVAMVHTKIGGILVIDTLGNVLFILDPFQFSEFSFGKCSNGLFKAKDKSTKTFCYLNMNGEIEIKPKFDKANDFSEGLACIRIGDKKTGKWGYIDKTGKVVIETIYDKKSDFSEGLACVRTGDKKTGKWGYIDKTGQFIIEAKFNKARNFNNGFAWVSSGDSKKINTVINKKGEIIWQK